jgi:hypothetical protein
MVLGTWNHCAGEGQEEFTGLEYTVYAPIVARQGLGKQVSVAKEIFGGVVLYATCVFQMKVGYWFFQELLLISLKENELHSLYDRNKI